MFRKLLFLLLFALSFAFGGVGCGDSVDDDGTGQSDAGQDSEDMGGDEAGEVDEADLEPCLTGEILNCSCDDGRVGESACVDGVRQECMCEGSPWGGECLDGVECNALDFPAGRGVSCYQDAEGASECAIRCSGFERDESVCRDGEVCVDVPEWADLQKICLPSCENDDDCVGNGALSRCDAGLCRPL